MEERSFAFTPEADPDPFNNAVISLLQRDSLAASPSDTYFIGDAKHLGMVHKDGAERDDAGPQVEELPDWARFEPSDGRVPPVLAIQVGDSDQDGLLSEHVIHCAYQDLLEVEAMIMPPGERPWRRWCGHQFYGQLMRAAMAKIKDEKIRHAETVKKGGKSVEISRAPALCCMAPG